MTVDAYRRGGRQKLPQRDHHSMPARNDPSGLVTILANPGCPHCVHATDTLTEWCVEAGLPVAGIDLAHHPGPAVRLGIEHSPSIVYRGRVLAGLPTHDEFLRFTRS